MSIGTDPTTKDGSALDAKDGSTVAVVAVQAVRLFFALWPEDSARAALGHAIRKVARSGGGRPVPEHNLHATLVFLGSVAVSRLGDLRAIAAQVAGAKKVAPFELDFDRVEYWQKPRVLVATASASSGVAVASALARTLLEAMQRADFDPDSKPFRPHITIARKVGKPSEAPYVHPIRLAFNSFALVESRTLPEGPVYRVLETFALD